MIRAFNALQLVSLFAAMPFLISWLHGNPFPYSTAAFYTAIAVYLILFVTNIAAVTNFVERTEKNW